MRTFGKDIADKVVVTCESPTPESDGGRWVGLQAGRQTIWDTTAGSEEAAESIAAELREDLARMIDEALDFDSYQERAFAMARYPGRGQGNITYPALGLCGEAGEVAEKIKKIIRDQGGEISLDAKLALRKELGDTLWYISALSRELGFTLSEVAVGNITKLEDRRDRGVLHGSGDDR